MERVQHFALPEDKTVWDQPQWVSSFLSDLILFFCLMLLVVLILRKNGTNPCIYHVKTTGHNIKLVYFDILAKGKPDYRCKIKEILFKFKILSQLSCQRRKWKVDALLIYSSFL